MKNFLRLIGIGVLSLFILKPSMANNGYSNCDPDSLEMVTIVGTVIVDTTAGQTLFYLDVDNDETEDYRLNFGPFWYVPPGGLSTRPHDGDNVTIYGGLNVTAPVLPVIIVYEINEEFWRNPYEPFWNHFNDHYAADRILGVHPDAPGWLQLDSINFVSLEGVVVVDSTFNYFHYYLDIDTDQLPDYKLNFGPPWYLPASGIERPIAGDTVSIYGVLVPLSPQDAFIVFQINGETWKEPGGFANESFGKWMHGNMNQALNTYDPFNMQNRIMFNTGWHGQGIPPMLFCHLHQVHFQNFPAYQGQNAFAGFQVGCFSTMGFGPFNDLMMQNGRKLRFNNEVTLQLHINQIQIDRASIHQRDRVRLKFYNEDSQSWETADAQIDADNDLVIFASSTLYSYYILTVEEQTTSVIDAEMHDIVLKNYPNPVSDHIRIDLKLDRSREVYLSIYDVLGKEVNRLIDGDILSGKNLRVFEIGDRLRDGIYYLHFRSEGVIYSSKFLVIK